MTKRQAQLLAFLKRYIDEHDGAAPCFDEITAEMGLASKSGVHRMLVCLEEQGLIRRWPQRARGIEIVGAPALTGGSRKAAVRAVLAWRDQTLTGLHMQQLEESLGPILPWERLA